MLAALVACHALPLAADQALTPLEIALAVVTGTALFGLFALFNALAALSASPLASGRR